MKGLLFDRVNGVQRRSLKSLWHASEVSWLKWSYDKWNNVGWTYCWMKSSYLHFTYQIALKNMNDVWIMCDINNVNYICISWIMFSTCESSFHSLNNVTLVVSRLNNFTSNIHAVLDWVFQSFCNSNPLTKQWMRKVIIVIEIITDIYISAFTNATF